MQSKYQFGCRSAAWGSMALILTAAITVLSGCRVGPPYHAPAPPDVTAANYKESTVNFHDEQGWKVASPQDAMIRGKWWEIFNEPELNALEEQLNVNNENIKVSFENFMEARTLVAQAPRAVLADGQRRSLLEPLPQLLESPQLIAG